VDLRLRRLGQLNDRKVAPAFHELDDQMEATCTFALGVNGRGPSWRGSNRLPGASGASPRYSPSGVLPGSSWDPSGSGVPVEGSSTGSGTRFRTALGMNGPRPLTS
jgi:hypothetical protein